MVHPLVLGTGAKFEGPRAEFRLAGRHTLGTGVIALSYEPA